MDFHNNGTLNKKCLNISNFVVFYKGDFNNIGGKPNLDFNKVKAFLKKELPYFDVYLSIEGLDYPSDLQGLVDLFSFFSHRQIKRRFTGADPVDPNDVFAKYPEIRQFMKELIDNKEYSLNPDTGKFTYPEVLCTTSFWAITKESVLSRLGPIAFSTVTTDKALSLNLFDLIDFDLHYYFL